MSFTTSDVITEVRELLLDELTPYRYSDNFILRKINQVLRRMAIARPDLFAEELAIICVDGALQSAPVDSIRVMDVLNNQVGDALKEVNQEVVDLMVPTWEGVSGPAVNWMRYLRDPTRFYIYPGATAGDEIVVLYVKCPPIYNIGQTVVLQDAYYPALMDGVCWLLESIDAEHVETGRAKMFMDSYNALLGIGLASRKVSDTHEAGMDKEDVK